ncbi:hypothetical protein [Shinella sp. M31]|uniref:hypothetical protein n=1 Tax=Shinella sp. M31 TaxID=3368615 RepID=UPI003B9F1DCE
MIPVSPSETIAKADRIWAYTNARGTRVWTPMKPAIAGAHEEEEYVCADVHAALALQVEAMKREMAEKDERIAALEKAITSPFCVVYLDGRNEHGTHVLPVLPTSINEEADDIADQAEAIMAASEAGGFETEDLVWAEFVNVPPQIGDEGRIELAGYWEFKGINAEMSALFNRRARTLIQGEKP